MMQLKAPATTIPKPPRQAEEIYTSGNKNEQHQSITGIDPGKNGSSECLKTYKGTCLYTIKGAEEYDARADG